jgi:endonuclease/exonuclease/phosphatase family metal-dependent hydrolase
MRFLLYNIRYATGTGAAFHLPVPGAGYLRNNPRVLQGITRFIKSADPDIVGLIEVDTGSIRSGRVNQADVIAESLGHYSIYQCKYGTNSLNTLVPIVNKQANAFLAAPRVEGERFHYFDTGIKRLIIELELDDICVFLVHLSLKFRHRQSQLRNLFELVRASSKPVIVGGDFNTFSGEHEMALFMEAAGLRSANRDRVPSYPARKPRMELDFILHTRDIEIDSFAVVDVAYSDHRPLICDFRVTKRRQRAVARTAAVDAAAVIAFAATDGARGTTETTRRIRTR